MEDEEELVANSLVRGDAGLARLPGSRVGQERTPKDNDQEETQFSLQQ